MNEIALQQLRRGVAIPAHPLALNANRQLDERRQRALTRYYIDSGVGGLAVGVHTTQFAIRDPKHGLFQPVLEIAAEEMQSYSKTLVRIGGVCGSTEQAVLEASLLYELGYDAALLSLASLRTASDDQLIAHCRTVASILPIVGFYLQPSVGGRLLSYSFWRRFVDIENVVAIKIAPFNRYQTLDVVRAVADSGRHEIALYTGNDDNIIADLLTPFRLSNSSPTERVDRGDVSTVRTLRIVGGLLGHWSVWTRKAVEYLEACKKEDDIQTLLELGAAVTDCNAAFFDSANGFRGCIAGLHEVLRRQRLLEGIWCLDENEGLSPRQAEEIDRVYSAYPHLCDDEFVRANIDRWLG